MGENFLLVSPEGPVEENSVKLIDFGASKICPPGERMTSLVGTATYVAPEVTLREPYTCAVDNWSSGVLLYTLLSGRLPFYHESDAELAKIVQAGRLDFPEKYWSSISEDVKDLIRRLMCMDPKDRLTANEALQDRWFAEWSESFPRKRQAGLSKHTWKNILSFRKQHRLKKAALHVI